MIEEETAMARQLRLSAHARTSLALMRRYLAEGDDIDSPRVVACVLRALELAKELAA